MSISYKKSLQSHSACRLCDTRKFPLILVDGGYVPTDDVASFPVQMEYAWFPRSLQIVVHRDGMLDLHLHTEVRISVLIIFTRSEILHCIATPGTEDVPQLSASFCGLCGCAKRCTSQHQK